MTTAIMEMLTDRKLRAMFPRDSREGLDTTFSARAPGSYVMSRSSHGATSTQASSRS